MGDPICDHITSDLSYPLFLTTKEGIGVSIACGNAVDFSLFEVDFLFSKARVKMQNGDLNGQNKM